MEKKIWVVSWILVFLVPFILVSQIAPTQSYRNLFFYADIYVANGILDTGFIPSGDSGNTLLGIDEKSHWGKIYNRQDLPIFPLIIAIFSKVTGLEPYIFYSYFPGYMFVALSYVLLIRKVTTDIRLIMMFAFVGAIAPNIRVVYSVSVSSLRIFILLLTLYCLFKLVSSPNTKSRYVYSTIILPIFFIWLFYWYPPNFIIVFLVSILLIITISLNNNTLLNEQGSKDWFPYLPVVVVGLVLLLQVFRIPLESYQIYFIESVSGLLHFDFNFFITATGSEVPPTVKDHQGYSIIPIITLLPFATLGGLICINKVVRIRSMRLEYNKNPLSLLLVIWGVSILTISLAYMATEQAWLSTRSAEFAFPLLIISSVYAIKEVQPKVLFLIILVISGGFLGVFYLQASLPERDIQSYQSGYEESATWVDRYTPSHVVGDLKSGALLAADGRFGYTHPNNYDAFYQLYYTENKTEYTNAMNEHQTRNLIYPKQIREQGGYFAPYHHKPTSTQSYEQRLQWNNRIYTNGNVDILEI